MFDEPRKRSTILESPRRHTIWIEAAQWSALAELARARKMSIAALVRQAIGMVLKKPLDPG